MRQIKATKQTLYFQQRKRTETTNTRKVKRKLKVQGGGKAEKSKRIVFKHPNSRKEQN